MVESNLRPNSFTECKFCHSNNVVKNGLRKGTQYWLCKNCGHGFVDNGALPKDKYPTEVTARAVYNYYSGMSINRIREGIEHEINALPSESSVYSWIDKYTRIALDEAQKYQPKVGDRWVMDETVIRLGGKKYWLICAIDSDSRFILGTKISYNRNKKDIQSVLEKATSLTGKIPKVVLSDGWGGYVDGIELAYGSESKHIISQPFTEKELSTNLIERWNGTLKDRLKPMRGMDRNVNFQLILDGFIFFYNYMRIHQSLGKTPAEEAKIKFPFKSFQDVAYSQSPPIPKPINPDISELSPKEQMVSIVNPKPYRKRSKIISKRNRHRYDNGDNNFIVSIR